MDFLWRSLLWVSAAGGLFVAGQFVHMGLVLAWVDRRTKNGAHLRDSDDQNKAYRSRLAQHRKLLSPVLWLLGKLSPIAFQLVSVQLRKPQLTTPNGVCTKRSIQKAIKHQAAAGDLFVATYMKNGTTWMQNLAYQVLNRGGGALPAESGKLSTKLGLVSTWLESTKTIPLDQLPTFGQPAYRIIKTHLPSQHCPFNDAAKYLMVYRHPCSTFASVIDFVSQNIDCFQPTTQQFEQWFQSPKWMWYGQWPQHVCQWLDLADQHSNILTVRFEDLKTDFERRMDSIVTFLEQEPLDQSERQKVIHNCSFQVMRQHQSLFEINPPHLFNCRSQFFVSGKTERHQDTDMQVNQRIWQWCEQEFERYGRQLSDYFQAPQASGTEKPSAIRTPS